MGSSNLLTKVYFARLVIPLATVLPAMIDFAILFVVLLGMMAYYGIAPTWNVLWLPLFLLLALTTALGTGLWLSAMNVQYRDIRYAVPFLVQFWMFASPVTYPSSLVSEPWRALYGINPMATVIEGFRWALLETHGSRAYDCCLGGGGGDPPAEWGLLLPAHGKDLRGCGVVHE